MYSPIMVSMRVVCSKCCISHSIRVLSPLGVNSDGHEPHPGWSLL